MLLIGTNNGDSRHFTIAHYLLHPNLAETEAWVGAIEPEMLRLMGINKN